MLFIVFAIAWEIGWGQLFSKWDDWSDRWMANQKTGYQYGLGFQFAAMLEYISKIKDNNIWNL